MDATTSFSEWASIIASLATFGALVALVIEIRNSRKAETRGASFELYDDLKTVTEDWVEINAIWQEETYEGFYKKFPPGSPERVLLMNITNFFELVGHSVYEGIIDKRMAFTLFGNLASRFWQDFKPESEAHRISQADQMLDAYFEWFALSYEQTPQFSEKRILEELDTLRHKK